MEDTIEKTTPAQEVVDTQIVAQETDVPQVFNIQTLIAQAIEKNIPVETMERLLAMAKDMKAEWAKEQYTKAMAAFQAECPTIEKTKAIHTNEGKLAYKYAPLESIVEQVKIPLQKNGFSYSTNMELLETGVKVFVKATHISGHSEVTEMNVPLGGKTKIMSDTQQVAAAQTFAKRYAFCNAFGILTGDEDTDAVQTEQPQSSQSTVAPSDKQLNLIQDMITKKGVTEDMLYADGFDIKNLTGGKDGTASELIEYLFQFRPQGRDTSLGQLTEGAKLFIKDLQECQSAESYQKISNEAKIAKEGGSLTAQDWNAIKEAAKTAYNRLTTPVTTLIERELEEMASKIDY